MRSNFINSVSFKVNISQVAVPVSHKKVFFTEKQDTQ